MKALGKKPWLPEDYSEGLISNKMNLRHYRQSLIEAADELDKFCRAEIESNDRHHIWVKDVSKKLRISAGVEK